MIKEHDFHLQDPTWCRGCGIFGVFAALKKASVSLDLDPDSMVVVTGIGCHGRFNNYFKAYGFHTLHGRALPVAAGVKLSNVPLNVIAISGDGDAYSIGLGHFIHAVRRNINIVYLVIDNRIYALTQGQPSPTTSMGFVTRYSPMGTKDLPLDGPQLALAAGGSFVARGFSGDPTQLAGIMEKAFAHKGFSVIDILSPCVTHNKINSYQWFKERIHRVEDDPSYDPTDRNSARLKLDEKDKIATGLLFVQDRPSFNDLVLAGMKPLVETDLNEGIPRIEELLKEFK